MFECVDTDRKTSNSTISGVVKKGNLILTVQIPTLPETGKLVEGGIREQTRQIFANLKQAIVEELDGLSGSTPDQLRNARREKFLAIG